MSLHYHHLTIKIYIFRQDFIPRTDMVVKLTRQLKEEDNVS